MYYKNNLQKDNYQNPYYKKEVRINKNFALCAIFAIVAGYWFYLLFYSPYFKIGRISINDLEYIDKEKVIDIINDGMDGRKFLIFNKNNYFFFDVDLLAEDIKKNFLTDGAEVEIMDINNLNIVINEKPSSITWITGDKYYYLDMDGNVKREVAPSEAERNYHIIYDGDNKEIENSQIHPKVIDKKYIEDALRIINEIETDTAFTIISFKYFGGVKQELYGKTNKGFEIYFNLSGDIDNQLNSLYVLLKEEVNEANMPKDYIDLRFEKKVYVK
ncbi:MAG: hypothetical protein V1860_00685 [bacterium]